jgi:hypothetical protein
MQAVRLSEASRDVAVALAKFDQAALDRLTVQLDAALAGDATVAREPAEAIAAQQRMLAELLAVTERNIHLLRRLHEAPGYRNER